MRNSILFKRAVVIAVAFAFVFCAFAAGMTEKVEAASKKKTLVIYFSRTDTTKKVAIRIRKITGADIARIKPFTEYPSNYDDTLTIAEDEQENDARPNIANKIPNFDSYDTIILGYPIWWGQQPMIINTFLESYNFEDKKVIPFCTSGGSGVGNSVTSMQSVLPSATFGTGLDATDASDATLRKWLSKNKVRLPALKVKVKNKVVTKKTVKLKRKKKAQLKPIVSNLDGKKKVTYSSTNKKVATVSKKGVVKAKRAGTARIKITVKCRTTVLTTWVKIKVRR